MFHISGPLAVPAVLILLFAVNLFSQYTLTQIGANSVQCPRPMSIGFYDSETNKTYMVWAGRKMTPLIKAFHHPSKRWSPTIEVGSLDSVISEKSLPFAYHDYPVVVKANDGHLLVFYCNHGSDLYMSRSLRPDSVEGEWEQRLLTPPEGRSPEPDGAPGYPSVFKTANGDIYVFFRGFYPRDQWETEQNTDVNYNGAYRPWGYIKSTDHGYTWSPYQVIINSTPNRPDRLNEIYLDGITYEPTHHNIKERFLLVWHIAGGQNETYPVLSRHNRFGRNVYFAYFYPGETPFLESPIDVQGRGGTNLGSEITDAWNSNGEMVRYCLVFNTGDPTVTGPRHIERLKAHYCDDGSPILVFEYRTNTGSSNWNYEAISYRWDPMILSPNKWTISENFKPGQSLLRKASLADLEKIDSTSFISYWLINGNIQAYKTTNAGKTWSAVRSENIDDPIRFSNVHLIHNYHSDIKFLITTQNNRTYNQNNPDDWIHGYAGEYTTYVAGKSDLPEIISDD